MSFKVVNALRKQGKLDEAVQLARTEYEALKPSVKSADTKWVEIEEGSIEDLILRHVKPVPDLSFLWARRALGWVLYDLFKQALEQENYEKCFDLLDEIIELNVPEDEDMFIDKMQWQVGKFVFQVQRSKNPFSSLLNKTFEKIQNLPRVKKTDSYSFLFKAFLHGNKEWNGFLDFANWWDFQSFCSEDFLEEEINARRTISLVERANISYAKNLLENKNNSDAIESFLQHLDNTIEAYPSYQYLPFYKAKLLLALGNKEDSLKSFLPFAKSKRNEFWIWSILGEMYSNDQKIRFSCLCKALSLGSPDSYLVKIRQELTDILIQKELFTEAKFEIEKIITTRKDNGWKTPNQVAQWTAQNWYKNTIAVEDNKRLYLKYCKTAEELLFQDVEEELIAVEFVNKNKNMISFVKDESRFGFFKYNPKEIRPKIGDVLKVKLSGENTTGFFKTLTLKIAENHEGLPTIKSFEGTVETNTNQPFGFVADIFIEPGLMRYHNLQNGDRIKGKAILSYNKSKDKWGWKVFEITHPTNPLKGLLSPN
jgi:tetratricopeptide (TPR) repeat protein